ncbi:MAG TPA: nickel-responsive transcriptional regulator NikR [Bacteroidota bacterium]|nr:nickel-responsive transcriptional regulator NikR [Bacteroidota bacterium]
MKNITRFGVSIDTPLIRRFDRWMSTSGYSNRSEALRDLIRGRLVEEDTRSPDTEGFGVLSLLYDHHKRDLEEKLTSLQHKHHHAVIAATHVHVDHDNCLEVILLKGRVGLMKNIAKGLGSFKGVKHSKLVLTSTEKHL